jgi:hypothetical protein
MEYLRVKKSFDNYKRADGGIHVANELYTKKEAAKHGVNPTFCDRVEISRKKTFFFFGARFEKNIN